MEEDLYRIDLQSVSGAVLFRAIEEFTNIDRPREERPREGYLLDFKEELGDRFLHSVAAFANTFGGLVVIGVRETDGRPEELVGVSVRGELKTKVASIVASNLFPCPSFEIGECELSKDPGKKLCVIRIRETSEVCLVTKKGESHPVYVRIEDKSEPADASQLRALLDRRRQSQKAVSEVDRRLQPLARQLWVTVAGNGPRTRSETYFRIILCPYNHTSVPLDLAVERRFSEIAAQQLPGLQSMVTGNDAIVEFHRWRDWYEWWILERAHDYERRWHLSTAGDIGFVTQTRWPVAGSADLWSVYDTALDIAHLLEFAKEFWQYTGFYGSFLLDAELNAGALTVCANSQGFAPLFYERMAGGLFFPIDRRAIFLSDTPRPTAQAQNDFAYNDLQGSLSDTVGAVLNQLLRCLGHVADLHSLKATLKGLVSGRGIDGRP